MKRYIGTKTVMAEPMTASVAQGKGHRTGEHHGDAEGY